jgi:hypothetical protein
LPVLVVFLLVVSCEVACWVGCFFSDQVELLVESS